MKILFDTSALLPSIWADHPWHSQARGWLGRVRSGELAGAISQHTLLETYSSLTGMPSRPKLGPALVRQSILEATSRFEVVELGYSDYLQCLEQADLRGLSGGIVYDLLLMRSAEKASADHVLTSNAKDFSRIVGASGPQIISLI